MRKYIKVIFTRLFTVLYAYFKWMIKYSKHPENYPLQERYDKVRALITKVISKFNVTIEDEGLKDLLNEPAGKAGRFIVSNHTSLADPLFYIMLSEKPVTFVCKKEVKKIPFVGRIVNIIEGVFLDRENLKEELKTFLQVGKSLKEKPELTWIVFAEGTRNKEDLSKVQEFKHGTFKFPMKAESDIVACSIMGSHRVVSSKIKGKYQIINIKLDKVIPQSEYWDYSSVEVAKLAHTYCQEGVDDIYPRNEAKFVEINIKKKKEKRNKKA